MIKSYWLIYRFSDNLRSSYCHRSTSNTSKVGYLHTPPPPRAHKKMKIVGHARTLLFLHLPVGNVLNRCLSLSQRDPRAVQLGGLRRRHRVIPRIPQPRLSTPEPSRVQQAMATILDRQDTHHRKMFSRQKSGGAKAKSIFFQGGFVKGGRECLSPTGNRAMDENTQTYSVLYKIWLSGGGGGGVARMFGTHRHEPTPNAWVATAVN